MSISLHTPDTTALQRVLDAIAGSPFTYDPVGATQHSGRPDGFVYDDVRVQIGHGRDVFIACGEFLQRWDLQRAMGFVVHAPFGTTQPDTAMSFAFRLFGVWFTASCRVVYTIDTPKQQGFAYGTLPGHPECGEEYFGVAIDDADDVFFEIHAFSRSHSRLARFGGPISRRLQLATLHRYGDCMHAFVESHS